MDDILICGTDIGGSHITSALININTRDILQHTWMRSAVHAKGTKEEIISCWCNTIQASYMANNLKPQHIGIAMPGPFDYENGISMMKGQEKYDALFQLDVKALIAENLGIRKNNISFFNDALCFLHGEVFNGAARLQQRVLGITLGTGFGAAWYKDDKITDADLWCQPYKQGIAEDYFSSRWFVKRYHDLTGSSVDNVKELMEKINLNAAVNIVLAEFAENLSNFLTLFVKTNAIEMVVIGGNIANAFDYFSAPLSKCLNELVPGIKVEKNSLAESAALIGAANSYCLSKENIHGSAAGKISQEVFY
jgi:glucokinase